MCQILQYISKKLTILTVEQKFVELITLSLTEDDNKLQSRASESYGNLPHKQQIFYPK